MISGPILIISDVHTRYDVINRQIAHAEELTGEQMAQVFVLGDFGFFQDEMHAWFRRAGHRFERRVRCVEGNHEDHADLENLTRRYADVVTHMPRGAMAHLGRWRALCLGGTHYMDAGSTPRGSEISRRDIDACLAYSPEDVDIVLTHDCPAHVGVPNTPGLEHYGPTGVPEMVELAEYYRPRWWFFGHHHRWFEKSLAGTQYLGLPQSWCGYVLLGADSDPRRVENRVDVDSANWWRRFF